MASSYEDTHCKRCGKECTAWLNGCLIGTSENGELVLIPKQSILYVEVEQD